MINEFDLQPHPKNTPRYRKKQYYFVVDFVKYLLELLFKRQKIME